MFNNIPGVDVDTDLTTDTSVYLVICEKDYPTILSQMGIINYIDLATDKDKHIFYRVSNGDYFTAKEFRIAHGYDNTFFEPVEAKHFGKHIEEICTVIPEKRD